MSYLVIDDFKLGMDRRKKRVSGVPGALWEGINGHITRGGDFERRKKFVKKYALPAGATQGLAQINKQLFVFGSAAAPLSMPAGINYQQLQHTGSANLSSILDTTIFSSKIYAVGGFDNGDIYHYYNGSRVTSWDSLAHASSGNAQIAAALAAQIDLDPRYVCGAIGSVITLMAAVAGTAFTISQQAIDGGSVNDQSITLTQTQANVAAVPETRATFQITIAGGTSTSDSLLPLQNAITALIDANGFPLLSAGVPWNVSNASTAGALAAAINDKGFHDSLDDVQGYSATVSGPVVTISAPVGQGASANSLALMATIAGSFSITTSAGAFTSSPSTPQNIGSFAGGVNAVEAVAEVYIAVIGGTYEDADQFILTIDGLNYITTGLAAGMGITALTYSSKVYSVAGSLVNFCAVNDPTAWASGTGYGSVNIANQDSDNDALVGLQKYQNRIAIFSRTNTQIWVLAVDPAANTFEQSVSNTGSLSNKATQQYGNIDVFYPNDQGVRSLRARDASNAPAVNDVGVAIDSFLQDFIATLTGKQISRGCSVIEPLSGRYWYALHNQIFVYSFYPGSKISAWTYYDLSDEIGNADITDMVRAGNRVYIRAGDAVYLYGGDTNQVYPNDNEIVATVSLPFLSAGKPSTAKKVKGFDCGLTNEWLCKLLPRAEDETVELTIGTFDKPTFSLRKNPIQHPCCLFALKLTCSKAGPATLSNLVVHYDEIGE